MFVVFMSMAACGGGGGGGSGNRPQGNFSIATSTVTFAAAANGPAPAAQSVSGSITGVDTTVFLFVLHTANAIAGATVQVTGATTGELTIFPKLPSQLGAGTFTDTVTVRACLDGNCSTEISGSPRTINVTYNVAGINVSSTSVTLTGVEGSSSQAVAVSVQNLSGASGWTTSVTYGAGGNNWLTVTPASGTSTAPSLSMTGDATLAPGTYGATVTFSANGFTVPITVIYNVTKNLGLSVSNVDFTAITGQGSAPAAQTASVTTALASTTYTTAITYGANGSGWLNVSGGTAPGVLTVQPTRTNLGPGTFTATVVLTPATGASVSLPVTYTLAASSLALNPGMVSFSIDGASTAADSFLKRAIATGDTGAALNWTATSSVPWLTVTGSGTSGTNALLTLVPAQLTGLANGQSTAIVTFTYNGPGVIAATKTAGVTLDLKLPTVSYVAPYVAYANEPEEVVVRGSGFGQQNLPQVMFGAVAAQTVVIRSDTELRVLPPTGLTAGARPEITIDNNLGLHRSRAQLVVRAHPAYGYAALPTNFGRQNEHMVYDAERDAVISGRAYFETCCEPASLVTRFKYDTNAGTWSMTSKSFDQLFDIALSPDGKELLVLTTEQLYRVDPVTLATISSVVVPGFSGGTASQLAVANDGKVIVRDAGRTYSLLDGTFTPLQGVLGMVRIDMSPDGSRATTGAATNAGDIPLSFYDSSTGEVHTTTAFQYYSPGSLTRAATKSLSGEFVRNADFSVFGELRDGAFPILGDVLAPDGDHVYIFRFSQGGSSPVASVRVFDSRLSTPVLPELSPITLPQADDPGIARVLISLDGKTLFLVGDKHFVVQPLP
jgi:hypothetical protein